MQFSDDANVAQEQVREGILDNNASSRGGEIPSELDYEQVLEKIGFGRSQWLLLVISGLLTITSIAAQQSIGIISIASQCEFNMSQAEKGVMMAACVAGIFLSTYIWGYVSDSVGRRSVLLYGIFISNALEVISMFVTNIWVFNVINLLIGISIGGVSAALYAYLSEFNVPRHRAVVINYSTMFVSVAAIYTPVTAWWVLSSDWSIQIFEGFVFLPWRLIILLNLLPGFIGGLLLLSFPESPKLLLAQNKEREAKEAVAWICKTNTGQSLEYILNREEYSLKPEILADEDVLANQSGCGVVVNIWKATTPLFHKPHGVHFMISCLAVFGMFFSSNGMQFWFPEIVNRSSNGASENSQTVCEILDDSFAQQIVNSSATVNTTCVAHISTKTYIDNMIVGIAFLVGFTIQGLLLNPFGRKNVLLSALGLATLSGILLHFVANTTIVLILFCLYILLPGLSISIMLGALVDFVPTHMRGKAVSVCMTLGRLGIIVAANLMGVMLEPLCNTTFGIFTCTMLICIFLVHFLPIKNST